MHLSLAISLGWEPWASRHITFSSLGEFGSYIRDRMVSCLLKHFTRKINVFSILDNDVGYIEMLNDVTLNFSSYIRAVLNQVL